MLIHFWTFISVYSEDIHFKMIIHTGYLQEPFYQHGLTLILAWISDHIPSQVWNYLSIPKLQQCNCLYLWMDK